MVLADPQGSILAPFLRTGKMIEPGSWAVEGIGEDFIPPNCDLSLVGRAYTISDKESIETARALAVERGHPGGLVLGHVAGGGAALLPRADDAQARRHARARQRQQISLQESTTIIWVIEQGLADRKLQGDLRDLIARRFDAGGTVTVGAGRYAAGRL